MSVFSQPTFLHFTGGPLFGIVQDFIHRIFWSLCTVVNLLSILLKLMVFVLDF